MPKNRLIPGLRKPEAPMFDDYFWNRYFRNRGIVLTRYRSLTVSRYFLTIRYFSHTTSCRPFCCCCAWRLLPFSNLRKRRVISTIMADRYRAGDDDEGYISGDFVLLWCLLQFTVVARENYGFFAPLPCHPLADSPPALVASWLVRPLNEQVYSLGLDENHEFTEAVNFGACREF